MIINSNILTRYLDNQLSVDEVRMVEAALESSAELRTELELLRYIHTCSSDITEIQPSEIDQNWNEFISRVQEPPVKPVKKFNWFKYAAVAAILILSGLIFYQSYFSGSVEQIAKTNQLFVLPDGSELLMSAGSTIGYNEKTFTSKRSVQMKGDILFRVKSNRKNPFFLLTSNSSIEVLGTKFRVFANTENTTVSLFKGELLIKSGNKSVYLQPGENATCVEGDLTKNNSKLADISSEWFSLDFESIPFSEIVKNLERRFDVDIKYPHNIKNHKYTIKAEGLKLEEILTILTELTNTTVIIDGRFIELKS